MRPTTAFGFSGGLVDDSSIGVVELTPAIWVTSNHCVFTLRQTAQGQIPSQGVQLFTTRPDQRFNAEPLKRFAGIC